MSERIRLRPGAIALALSADLAALPVAWPPPLHAALLAIALGWAPGWLVARHLRPPGDSPGRALLALVLSPFLAALPAAVLLYAGISTTASARAVLLAVAFVALLHAFSTGRPTGRTAESARGGFSGVAWVAALLWAIVMGTLLIGNSWLPPRSDGWFHAAVTQRVVLDGVPPEDPFFAGLRLLYFWGYHTWAALWLAAAPRLAVWTPLIVLNLAGAGAVVLGVCLLAKRLGAGPRGQVVAAGLATLGYAPFAWGWVALRSFTGQVVGMEEVRRYLSHGLSLPMTTMGWNMLHPSMVFFGDKFLVITPFSIGLALFTAWLVAFLDVVERPTRTSAVALSLVQAAALFLHSVVGWSMALLAVAWWWWALWRARRPEEAHLRRSMIPLALAVGAALVVSSPYLAITTLGKHQSLAPGLSASALLTWLWSGALVVPLGMAWLARRGQRGGAARELTGLAVVLTVIGLSIKLPENNQSKFFNLLFLLLAAPAALGWLGLFYRLRNAGRALLAGALVLAVAPTVFLCVWGFASERGEALDAWPFPTAAEREGLLWVRSHTPKDAMLVDGWGPFHVMVVAARSVVWGGEKGERDWGYAAEDVAPRRAAFRELSRLNDPDPEVRDFLARMGRPVIVVARRRNASDLASAWNLQSRASSAFRPIFRNAEIAFYRWQPGP